MGMKRDTGDPWEAEDSLGCMLKLSLEKRVPWSNLYRL